MGKRHEPNESTVQRGQKVAQRPSPYIAIRFPLLKKLTNIINFRTPKSHTSWVEGAITETTTTPNNQVETDRQNCIVALLVPYNGQSVCSPCSLLTLPKVLTRRIYLAITSFLRQ